MRVTGNFSDGAVRLTSEDVFFLQRRESEAPGIQVLSLHPVWVLKRTRSPDPSRHFSMVRGDDGAESLGHQRGHEDERGGERVHLRVLQTRYDLCGVN